jgi:hypothetical protein
VLKLERYATRCDERGAYTGAGLFVVCVAHSASHKGGMLRWKSLLNMAFLSYNGPINIVTWQKNCDRPPRA